MTDWHVCNTTHCRAGWTVHLAGEDGYKLERLTSTAFAARQIYKASSNIEVKYTAFYKSNEEAMDDIERCYREEIKGKE